MRFTEINKGVAEGPSSGYTYKDTDEGTYLTNTMGETLFIPDVSLQDQGFKPGDRRLPEVWQMNLEMADETGAYIVDDEQGIAEAPGAETLGHNQSTVASNLNSLDLGEGDKKPEQPEADYGDDYQDMVARVKKLAGLGPLRTVYDPNKRVYKNVPTAVQPGDKK